MIFFLTLSGSFPLGSVGTLLEMLAGCLFMDHATVHQSVNMTRVADLEKKGYKV